MLFNCPFYESSYRELTYKVLAYKELNLGTDLKELTDEIDPWASFVTSTPRNKNQKSFGFIRAFSNNH